MKRKSYLEKEETQIPFGNSHTYHARIHFESKKQFADKA